MTRYSWGRYPAIPQRVHTLASRFDALPRQPRLLPHGNGRSYGDSCLSDDGTLLETRWLDRFVAFDRERGVLRCEAGVRFDQILQLVVPAGWFLPVTPGTQFVTVGGAIANDVHGKNHHRAGSFGCHVRCFELLRSDGSRIQCSASEHPELFAATLGGLGLTGLVTWAEFSLLRIASPWIATETRVFRGIPEFLQQSAAATQDYEYTVAWIDCTATGRNAARGLFFAGNHAGPQADRREPRRRALAMPFTPPLSLVNRLSVNAMNRLYFHGNRRRAGHAVVHYQPYFYPLDAVADWNRMYGPRGFVQHQCVVPMAAAAEVLPALLERIARHGEGSFLAVLKVFGERSSPGMLSFPRAGVTLALDFPIRGPGTFALLDALDADVAASGGAVYPAKDARMSAALFQQGFPRWREFRAHMDPAFSSRFWRRVTEQTCAES